MLQSVQNTSCYCFRFEWLLAFRAITQKPLEYFLEMKDEFVQHCPTYGTDADPDLKTDFLYDESDYKVLFNFVTLHVTYSHFFYNYI